MRPTWTAVALTAALSLTTVTATTATFAYGSTAAVPHRAHPIAVPAAGRPALPDPAKNLAALGSLGDVLQLVNGIVAKATPTTGVPDPGALQKLVDQLVAAIKDLLGKLGIQLPVSAGPVNAPARTLPAVGLPLSPSDALANVKKDVDALVAAATAAKPDPTAVKNALPPLSTDTIAATASTATALAPVP